MTATSYPLQPIVTFDLPAYTQLLQNLDLESEGLACLEQAQTGHWFSFDLSQPADNLWEILRFWATFLKAWKCVKETAIEVKKRYFHSLIIDDIGHYFIA